VEKLYIDGLFQIKIKTYYEENSRMTRFQRKCRKLLKNPKQFFRDSFLFKKINHILNNTNSVFYRKYNKLLRDPKLFFEDSTFIKKAKNLFRIFRHQQHYKYLSLSKLWFAKKPDSHIKYSVVTAVYNVEKYLDDYFKSITRQTLDFKGHIQLILVDDGSVDKSAQIIKKWQKKFPDNITYIYQENQGAAIARNNGIPLVKNDWVTFIDSDDFVSPDYFYEVNKQLEIHRIYDIKALFCKQISYYEANGEFKDDRPFKTFFANETVITPCDDLENRMHFATNTTFFLYSEIKKQKARFSVTSHWPSFEDAHFILRHIGNTAEGYNIFCRKPVYYYRKRKNQLSYTDTYYTKKWWYLNILKEAYLDLFDFYAQKYNSVPLFVQNSILYDISWKIKVFINDPRKSSILSEDEQKLFLELCDRVFSYIDTKTIVSFSAEMSGFWYFLKIGTINCFKREKVACKYIYIDEYDYRKNLIKFKFWGNSDASIYFDGKKADIVYSKTIKREFLTRVFIDERHIWVKLKKSAKHITGIINNKEVELDFAGKKYKSLSFMQLISNFKNKIPFRDDHYWIFMDRDIEADDSAEHLYRFVAKNYSEQKIYFALRKKSSDWNRLKSEGFNLINFGSRNYFKLLKGADKLISSHMGNYIVQYKKDIIIRQHFICLQHGVIKDNLSAWLNNIPINLFITATNEEYKSITDDNTTYNLSKKEVVNTGLARHDALLERSKQISIQRKILVMPTWRKYLVSSGKTTTSTREALPDFFDSDFAKAWFGLLKSKKLKSLAEKYDFKIIFFPHLNMQSYFKNIKLGSHIELTLRNDIVNLQDLFVGSAALITDYSSVAFNMAYLYKTTLYYQFDEDEFFKGHTATKGYFDYRDDGFGAVVADQNTLLKEIETIMKNGGKPAKKYLKRMQETFPVRDGKNCERIYNAILSLNN
jgi:glycosyltransferase involved in cell wall biosynthesis/CDP-glycerol glycerophosphotransferase (TagB/SpsB family)